MMENNKENSKSKVQLGRLVATEGITNHMSSSVEFCLFVNESLQRYLNADWGECDEEDRERNDAALVEGDMLMGVYNDKGNSSLPETIWIITELDRSVTTILLPEEY